MECPVCACTLQKFQVGNVEVDACALGCGGIWFDQGELEQFDETQEFTDSEIFKIKSQVSRDPQLTISCPKCVDQKLVKQFLDVRGQVQVDLCWSCSGVWLDHGELESLRQQYDCPTERAADVDKAFNENLQDLKANLKSEEAFPNMKTPEELARNSKVVRFIGKFLGIKELMQD